MKKRKRKTSRQLKIIRRKLLLIMILSCLIIIGCVAIIALKNISEDMLAQFTEETRTSTKGDELPTIESKSDLQESIAYILDAYDFDDKQLSYIYYDPKDDETIQVNEDEDMLAASTYKLPLAMYYYDLIEKGVYTKDTALPFYEEAYMPEEGLSTIYTIDDQIPLSYLIRQAIVNSDNSASLIMLYTTGVLETYQAFSNYGAKQYTLEEINNNVTTARSSMEVLKYLYNHQDKYQELIDLLKIASQGYFLQAGTAAEHYEIAHKYGEFAGYVNDYGIVYTEEPYLIAIFTDGIVDSPTLIADLNDVFCAYHQQKYK
ncbi:beta-lactamase class A [Breznakia blatticola]|uniref:Beta-lactamase class A n=1 Tax=Breznakia blatticola TaxID=1754012 RepID=A0A4R7ZBA0_9FIRM|nr:serine hydrolase [Breznakia blatticola]TDW14787.1 beta-lactamase class A [Breznakia blatticola]